jgi:hypothetical protein
VDGQARLSYKDWTGIKAALGTAAAVALPAFGAYMGYKKFGPELELLREQVSQAKKDAGKIDPPFMSWEYVKQSNVGRRFGAGLLGAFELGRHGIKAGPWWAAAATALGFGGGFLLGS